ncbi:divalent-cation tolerance protein CutA [Lacibacterium aquatile]|uniref:Divalent-cation tolerance protein CutA n=1 Tax=Lacibacterium aquatile TaxID=1168082 RepID=A0ABW5DRH5_9PROT
MAHDVTLIYAVLPDVDAARAIAGTLVEERLIACANILPGTTSIYRWEGEICEAQEVVMICKTSADQAVAARDRLAALHPYDVPAILELPTSGGHFPFQSWVTAETDNS